MYVPAPFSQTDRPHALELIERYPFGLLATCDGEYPCATHLPMVVEERENELVVLGHVARANPHAQSTLGGARATAIFQGAHAYVSPSWYEEPYRTVPTWNYTAVHAYGRLREVDSRHVLKLLVRRFEDARADPWRIEALDAAYYEKQLAGIVAFELPVERLDSSAKLSQNRTSADRERVIEALSRSVEAVDRDCAEAMRRIDAE